MQPTSKEILVVGLNPAFQATLHFDHFRQGKVNRAFRKCNSIGGKGQNFAIACAQYGEADRLSVLQLVGGMTGRYIQAFLDEQRIEHISISIRKASRTCTTVLDKHTGDMTELIEPAARIEPHEREQLEKVAREVIISSPKLEAIALCGTLPPGVTGSIYAFIAQLKPPSVILLLDAAQHAIECLNTGKVDILKINSDEARFLANAEDSCDLSIVGKQLYATYSIRILAITNGPDEAYLFEKEPKSISNQFKNVRMTVYKIPPLLETISDMNDIESSIGSSPLSSSLPEATGKPSPLVLLVRQDTSASGFLHPHELVNRNLNFQKGLCSVGSNSSLRDHAKEIVINPLGAGDTCSGIFLLEYLESQNAVNAFRHGLAAASASCLVVDYTSRFDMKVKTEIYERISHTTQSFELVDDSTPTKIDLVDEKDRLSAGHLSPMFIVE